MNKISVIIIDWKDNARVLAAIDKLLTYNDLELVVYLVQLEVDKDAHPLLLDSRVRKILSDKNLGFGMANNLGLKASIKDGFKYSLLLNADAEIPEESIEQLISTASQHTDAFSIGPILVETHNNVTSEYIGGRDITKFNNTRKLVDTKDIGVKNIIDVFYNIGAAILLNNEHLLKVGLFDGDYFFSGEVADLCFRARKLNLRCITTMKAKAYHYPENHSRRKSLYQYYSTRNRILFIRKHNLPKSLTFKWLSFLLKEVAYNLMKFDKRNFYTFYICFIHSIANIKGNQNHKFINS